MNYGCKNAIYITFCDVAPNDKQPGKWKFVNNLLNNQKLKALVKLQESLLTVH